MNTENQTDVPEITPTQQESTTPALPKDLEDLWGSVEACATAFAVLGKATHSQKNFKAVEMSMTFLMKLHEQCVERCLAHKDAGLIPDLKKIVDAQEKRERKAKKNVKKEH